jgi:hypothetical protein
MKTKSYWVFGIGIFLLCAGNSFAITTNVYSTQFEAAQGYNTANDLAGQQGWLKSGTGGNGVVSNGIANQSAYIGFAPPNPANSSLILWKPINFNPVTAGYPVVKFSTQLSIEDSTNARRDIFRWSIYNIPGNRLFSIDLDNENLDLSYLRDGTNTLFITTNLFTNSVIYTLNVTMNFASNRWSASLDNRLIATNQPITSTNAQLTLGDIDAVWLVNQISGTNAPGNNFMVFDNYTITAETLTDPTAQVQLLGRTVEGWTLLRVNGQNGWRWSLDATTNLVNWTALKTNPISGTSFDHVDTTSAGRPHRFYRARLVP